MTGRSFLIWFVGVAAAIAAGVFVALVAIDPFDRGHGIFNRPGTLEGGPRTATVSRARDARFNAAIFGNSHVQLLKPERLNALTGFNWVQLTIPATTPLEQFAAIEWFRINRPTGVRAIILGADHMWCSADPALKSAHPFPHWLYDASGLVYFPNLFRMQAARILPRRVGYLLGRVRARAADGYWDYEAYRVRDEAHLRREIATVRAATFWNESDRFPWIDRLGRELSQLPKEVRVAIVTPPVHPEILPDPGSAQGRAERACVAALQRIAMSRPGTDVIDARKDSARFSDPRFFWDATHYSRAVAEIVESAAAEALTRAEGAKSR